MGASPDTIKAYRSDLMDFLFKWDEHKFHLPLEFNMAEYITAHRVGWSPATTSRKLSAFRAYGRWCGNHEFLRDYKAPKVGQRIPHPLPGLKDDLMLMYGYARKPHHRAIVVLCGFLGLRISEARSVTVNSFEDHAEGTVLTVRGKGDKTRYVPVSEVTMALLDDAILVARKNNTPLVPVHDRTARRAWTTMGRRAGLMRATATHDGRMTFGTLAYVRSNNDIRAVQELLGHTSVNTTQVYTGISEATRRKAAAII